MNILTYDLYVEHFLNPILSKCPFFENAKDELNAILGGIPSEKMAYEKAFEKSPHYKKLTNKVLCDHPSDTMSSQPFETTGVTCAFTIGSPTASTSTIPISTTKEQNGVSIITDFYIFVEKYGDLHFAPLSFLVDHLLSSLGWTICHYGKREDTPLYSLLSWYSENHSGQIKYSKMMYIRECADFTQALNNTQNRIKEILRCLLKRDYNKNDIDKLTKEYVCKLIGFAGVHQNEDMKKIVSELIDKIRGDWVHHQNKEILSFLDSPDGFCNVYNKITQSFRAILLQYEGLFRWYLEPSRYDIKRKL